MENKVSDKLKDDLLVLNKEIDENDRKRLNVNQLIRVIERLDSFSADCKECGNYLNDFAIDIENLTNKLGEDSSLDFKEFHNKVNDIISHFQKKHKLISDGYYLSIYMSIGMSIGMVFGLLFMDTFVLGLSFGLSIGIAIGASLDADAKKKGLTL